MSDKKEKTKNNKNSKNNEFTEINVGINKLKKKQKILKN